VRYRARGFLLNSGNVTIDNLTFADALALGARAALATTAAAARGSINQVRTCFYPSGTKENDRFHRPGKWLRVARSLTKFLREAPNSLLLCALDRSPFFLCVKNTSLLDC